MEEAPDKINNDQEEGERRENNAKGSALVDVSKPGQPASN
jgi:hypothetical protein